MRAALFCALAVLAAMCSARPLWHELHEYTFDQFEADFSRTYTTPEERAFRKGLFEKRLADVRAHNTRAGVSWKKGINHMSDHTDEERRARLGLRKDILYSTPITPNGVRVMAATDGGDYPDLPATVDWRELAAVGPTKDQGHCGSCWTFATAETVESYYKITHGELMDLSEQQILDCTPNPQHCGGTGGCQGGTGELAIDQIVKMGGLATEWTYPYVSWAGPNFSCNMTGRATYVKTVSGYGSLPSNEYFPVLAHLARVGPLAVSVDASAWGDYETGVFDACNQTTPDIDHLVQLVGYGTDREHGPYWLVRNSWAANWGEEGYIRIRRNTDKTPCGIDVTPGDGDGCEGGPAQVKVCGECAILYDAIFPVMQGHAASAKHYPELAALVFPDTAPVLSSH
eukprot:CAMPEP_0177658644 /NCGR_PEP_ID=MMETSP0447-20121125/16940_1 /TAXON_ID=0 /ORGANISM="Stygamoeba regulata, Strain BSH-02190019" /LENGTH=399 /DNA_ID=CAMNT_0019163303 /DNA_START=89 /DNA_END=1288 /DNA_ORIENTATION=-